MKRIEVQSKNIAAIAYDAEKSTLEIEFMNHALYHYSEVPEKLFEAFSRAPSKGMFFADFVRGRYAFARIPRGQALK